MKSNQIKSSCESYIHFRSRLQEYPPPPQNSRGKSAAVKHSNASTKTNGNGNGPTVSSASPESPKSETSSIQQAQSPNNRGSTIT